MSNNVTVDLKGNNDPLKRALSESKQAIGQFGSNITTTFLSIGAAVATAFSAQKIVEFAKDCVTAASEARDAMATFEAVTIATGNSSKFTADQLSNLSTEIQILTKFEDDNVVAAAGVLSIYQNISGDAFPRAIRLGTDMAQLFGGDLTQSIRTLGKALDSPKEGMTALTRVGIRLDDDMVKLIERLVDAGDTAGAQAVLFDELEGKFAGLAVAAGETASGQLEQLKNRFGDLQEQIGEGLIPVFEDLIPLAEVAVESFSALFDTFSNNSGIDDTTNKLSELEKVLSGIITIGGNVGDVLNMMGGNILPEGAQETFKTNERLMETKGDTSFLAVWDDTRRNMRKQSEENLSNELNSVQNKILTERQEREQKKKDAAEEREKDRAEREERREQRKQELIDGQNAAKEVAAIDKQVADHKKKSDEEHKQRMKDLDASMKASVKEQEELEKDNEEKKPHSARFEGLEGLNRRIQESAASGEFDPVKVQKELAETNKDVAKVGLQLFDVQNVMVETLEELDSSLNDGLAGVLEEMTKDTGTSDKELMEKQNSILGGLSEVMTQDKALNERIASTNEKIAIAIPDIGKLQ